MFAAITTVRPRTKRDNQFTFLSKSGYRLSTDVLHITPYSKRKRQDITKNSSGSAAFKSLSKTNKLKSTFPGAKEGLSPIVDWCGLSNMAREFIRSVCFCALFSNIEGAANPVFINQSITICYQFKIGNNIASNVIVTIFFSGCYQSKIGR